MRPKVEYIRIGRTIYYLNRKTEPEPFRDYDSVNQAKRASRYLQEDAQGRLGGGGVLEVWR